MSGKAILTRLVPILVGVMDDAIICSKTPLQGFSTNCRSEREPDSYTVRFSFAASHLGLRYL